MKTGNTTNSPCKLCKVRDISCFGHLDALSANQVTHTKSNQWHGKSDLLFREGEKPKGVYCLKRGKVKVFKMGIDGKEHIIQIAREGDLLGYRAMMGDDNYPVSAQTLEETESCFITQAEFLKLLNTSKDLNNKLLKQACQEIADFTESITHQAQLSVRERCAIALHKLYQTYGGNGTEAIEINLTREDLANIVGTATETLIRLIHDFKAEGILNSKGRKIIIQKPDRLKAIGHISG